MTSLVVVLFLAGCAFVIYALVGYPLSLMMMARARRRSRSATSAPAAPVLPSVSVLLPVANGERWVRPKLESILALDYPAERMEILVVSDGSTDATDSIVEAMSAEYPARSIRLYRVPKGGKARALNAVMPHASGEILFFTDVRQKLDRACLSFLVAPFADSTIGGVCGELIILDGDTQEEQSVGLYWKVEKWIRRQLSQMGTLLVVTGCLYAMRRHLVEPIPENALGDDIFMPQAILRKGFRVVFEDRARAFDYPTGRDVEFRRKVRTLAGIWQFVGKHGLGPYPLHFFWYKMSRVLLPWALILVALTTPFLPYWLAIPAAVGEAILYVAALVDPAIGDRSPLKRISSPARTFCMLMIAAAFSISVLFRPAEELWKPSAIRVRESAPHRQ